MLQLTPHMKIYVCCQPIDFRKGIDSLVGVCRALLGKDPFSGALFLFKNRSATSLKILVYDGQGFWLCTKRWSEGKLTWWPDASSGILTELAARELGILLWNGNPRAASFGQDWRPLPKTG